MVGATGQERSIYICLATFGEPGEVTYTVYSIDLSNLLFSDSTELLKQVFEFPQNLACAGFGIFDSKFLLAGGFQGIFLHELGAADLSPDVYSYSYSGWDKLTQLPFPSLLQGKASPLIWEVDGKLFCLARGPPPPSADRAPTAEWSPSFEVYDPALQKWNALADPPCYKYPGGDSDPEHFFLRFNYYSTFYHAILGSQIFVSNPLHHPNYTYKCDLSSLSDKEWQVSPFQFEGATLGVYTDEGHLVIFSHNVIGLSPADAIVDDRDDPFFYIKVDMMLGGSDQQILPSQYLFIPQGLHGIEECHFVHLGGRKASLLCSRTQHFGKKKFSLTVITFEFQLEICNIDSFQVNADFQHRCIWEYEVKGQGDAQVVGAVVC